MWNASPGTSTARGSSHFVSWAVAGRHAWLGPGLPGTGMSSWLVNLGPTAEVKLHLLTSFNCQTIDISMPPSRSWQMANMFGRTGFQEPSMNCLLMTDDDGSHASSAIFCQHNQLRPFFSDLWRPTTRTMRSSDSPPRIFREAEAVQNPLCHVASSMG